MTFDKALNLSENLLTFLQFQALEGGITIDTTGLPFKGGMRINYRMFVKSYRNAKYYDYPLLVLAL